MANTSNNLPFLIKKQALGDMKKNQSNTTVLLVNLGTPDAPSYGAVRRYLKEFLWDKRVVDTFRPLWWLILNLIILVFRPFKAGKAYRSVWNHYGPNTGSPLLHISQQQQKALAQVFAENGENASVELAMTYGNPNVQTVMERLATTGIDKLIVLPMYPQYSATTTAAVFDAVAKALGKWRSVPELVFIRDYHQHPAYIDALTNSVLAHQTEHAVPDRLVLSFHGIPIRYCDLGDTYRDEVQQTSKLLSEALQVRAPQNTVIQTYQSRVGAEPWLQPYTDETMTSLGNSGVESVQLICPGFAADCLETIEEIEEENRDIFLENGGKTFSYISALNDRPEHIAALYDVIKPHLLHASQQ